MFFEWWLCLNTHFIHYILSFCISDYLKFLLLISFLIIYFLFCINSFLSPSLFYDPYSPLSPFQRKLPWYGHRNSLLLSDASSYSDAWCWSCVYPPQTVAPWQSGHRSILPRIPDKQTARSGQVPDTGTLCCLWGMCRVIWWKWIIYLSFIFFSIYIHD